MRTEQDFLAWLSGASIYIGYDRYGQFGPHGFVCASSYSENDKLEICVSDLDAGDNDAIEAAGIIKAATHWHKGCDIWYASDRDPSQAMSDLVEQIRRYYFDVLNAAPPTITGGEWKPK